MTITQINASCAPYEVTGRTTLGTVLHNTRSEDVILWVNQCVAHEGCDYDTALNEIEDICGWRLCPFEGERLMIEADF
jgi:hypothetical protein